MPILQTRSSGALPGSAMHSAAPALPASGLCERPPYRNLHHSAGACDKATVHIAASTVEHAPGASSIIQAAALLSSGGGGRGWPAAGMRPQ